MTAIPFSGSKAELEEREQWCKDRGLDYEIDNPMDDLHDLGAFPVIFLFEDPDHATLFRMRW